MLTNPEAGFSTIHYQDGEFKRHAASKSGAIVVLCTKDKIEALGPYQFMPSEDVDYLIYSPNDTVAKEYLSQLDCTVITSNPLYWEITSLLSDIYYHSDKLN